MKLNRNSFAHLVNLALSKSNKSNRHVAGLLDLPVSTFTRISKFYFISTHHFIIILCWVRTTLNFSWETLMLKILESESFDGGSSLPDAFIYDKKL